MPETDVFGSLPPVPDPDAVPPTIETYPERTRDPQITFKTIADEYSQHDRIALAGLSLEELRAQAEARRRMWKLVVTYWEQAKANGWDPALRDEWASVAGMLDVLPDLTNNAEEALDAAEEAAERTGT